MSTFTCPICGQPHRTTSIFCPTTGQRLPSGGQPTPGYPVIPQAAVSPMPGMTGRLPPNMVIHNRFAIIKKIGEGGMAAVYQAADTRLPGKVWAVKEMSESMITDPQERVQAVRAFQQEAILLAKLNHPNLPRVIDSFTEGGRHYLVMEYVHGQTLEKMLAQRAIPFTESEITSWVGQLCSVLAYLHSQQPRPIIFRDLKPSNIMVDQAGQIKLIDFGIVRFFKPGKSKDTQAIGTQGYCAPEALSGQTDGRSDLYSLCVVIYELLTKHDPTTTVFSFPPIRQKNPRVSAAWERVLQRGLESDRNRRWPDVRTLGAELSRAAGVVLSSVPVGPYPVQPHIQPQGQSQPFPRTSRPTTRLVTAAAQLSTEQLAAGIGGTALAVIIGLWLLTPVLVEYTFIWNNIPIVAFVAPFVYAAMPRRWIASIAHAILAFVGGLTIHFRIGGDNYYIGSLILGALLSAAFIEIWLGFLEKVRGPDGQEAWKREIAWYCGMAAIATGLLYELSLGSGLNILLWIGAALMAALGWFLGDMVKQYLSMRQTGFRKTP